MLRLLLRFDLLEDDLEAIAGRWKKVTDVFGSALVEIVELLWSSFQRLDAGAVRVGVHSVVQVVSDSRRSASISKQYLDILMWGAMFCFALLLKMRT